MAPFAWLCGDSYGARGWGVGEREQRCPRAASCLAVSSVPVRALSEARPVGRSFHEGDVPMDRPHPLHPRRLGKIADPGSGSDNTARGPPQPEKQEDMLRMGSRVNAHIIGRGGGGTVAGTVIVWVLAG